MYFVDTSIFLEFLLGQQKASQSIKFIELANKTGILLVCSHFSIHAIESILSKTKKYNYLKKFLENLEFSENIIVCGTSLEEELEIIKIVKEKKLDFDDALQYFTAKKMGCKTIVSFDKHFDKTDLKRKTPLDTLAEIKKQ